LIRFDSETLGIIGVTLRMALFSTALSAVFGISLGLLMEGSKFPGKKLAVRLCRTLMGMPPVVVGLAVYLLLMRRGPLGFLKSLFTLRAMIFAQVIIITPIICGLVYTCAVRSAPLIREFAKTMGVRGIQRFFLIIRELGGEIYFALITGFGRAISEVGSVMIVGGNIQYKTRTMTTAISLMRNKGNYSEAITLGVVLLIIAFILQTLADFLRREKRTGENY
jgi:tungstate transport system permease protein